MKKMRSKILSALLAAAMLVTLFAGCGDNSGKEENKDSQKQDVVQEDTGKAADDSENADADDPYKDLKVSDEVVEVTAIGVTDVVGANWTDSLQFKEYEKRLNIRIIADTLYNSETWATKKTTIFAADELPDIICNANLDDATVSKYAKDGYLLNIADYLDVMPNFKALLEEYPLWAAAITSDDGGIYGIKQLNNFGSASRYGYIFMNQSWLDNLGLERPETLEDFYNVLVAFRDQDADGDGDASNELPMVWAQSGGSSVLLPIKYAFGIESNDGYYMMGAEDGNVFLYNTTDAYKDYVKFLKKLVDEDLVNDDPFTYESTAITGLTENGSVGFFSDQISAVARADGENETKYGWYGVPGFTQEGYQDERITVTANNYGSSFALLVNSETEYATEICKFIDYLFTPEGSLSGGNGYEGITFDWVEIEEGFQICDHVARHTAAGVSQEEYRNQVLAVNAVNVYRDPVGTIYDACANISIEYLDDPTSGMWSVATVNALKASAVRNSTVVDPYPNLIFTDDEATERATLKTDIENYLKTTFAQWVMGETDIDAEWDGYLKQLETMGLDRLLEIEQAAYDRMVK